MAPKDNKNGVKLKSPEIRQKAYKAYCDHIAKGKSKKSFTFITPEYSCHWQTLEAYIKDKSEFDPLQMELAYHQGYNRWEQVVEDSAEGKNKEANTASLQMLMRNKFEWDKDRPDKSQVDASKLEALAEFINRFDSSKSPEKSKE